MHLNSGLLLAILVRQFAGRREHTFFLQEFTGLLRSTSIFRSDAFATMAYPWKTRRVRQIGNALLVPLARALGAGALS